MKRRALIKYISLATGGTIAAPLLASLLSGCQAEGLTTTDDYAPQFFSNKEFAVIRNLVDIILPNTDSPSGSEVGVHRTIDKMLFKTYKTEDQLNYKNGFYALLRFLSKTADEAELDIEAVIRLKDQQKEALLSELNTSTDKELKTIKEALQHLKQQSIAYYLSTKEIATNYLNYLPVPGQYEPCIALKDTDGKAWAL